MPPHERAVPLQECQVSLVQCWGQPRGLGCFSYSLQITPSCQQEAGSKCDVGMSGMVHIWGHNTVARS